VSSADTPTTAAAHFAPRFLAACLKRENAHGGLCGVRRPRYSARIWRFRADNPLRAAVLIAIADEGKRGAGILLTQRAKEI